MMFLLQRRRMNCIRWWDWITLCCFVLLGCPAAIVGDAGSDYLDSKQVQVEMMATQAIENYNQQCELLASCNNVANCSHSVCAPLVGDREGLTCMTVKNNTYCSVPGQSSTPCTSRNLDYRRSYVRVAASTDLKSVDTMLSICSQRELEPLIKGYALLNPSVVTRLYFASMDGSWRVIPGSAQSVDNCNIYDARIRPWFRTAISVMKVVTVLIDIGASMNSDLPPNYGAGTMLQVAQNMVTQLLLTLSANDHVNIIVFNSTGAYQLSPTAILVLDHNTTALPELQPLLDALDSQKVESQYRQSNLTAAIVAALPNFESNPSAAKVIVVISDGMFATLGNVSLPSTGLSGVKIFLYILPLSQSPDLGNNTLIKQLCAVGGHYEPILKNLGNPLLALNKFFSYLANLKRIETNALPQYSALYQDFEQIGGNIITVTKPAFSDEGDLIGVAGLTIYPELLGNLTVLVNDALGGRVTGYNAPAKQILLTAANCSSVSETTQPCGVDNYVANGGLCTKTDLTSTIQSISCCGACSVSNGSRKSHHVGVIVAVVMGSLVSLLLLVGFGLCAYRAYQKKQEEDDKSKHIMTYFEGDRQSVKN